MNTPPVTLPKNGYVLRSEFRSLAFDARALAFIQPEKPVQNAYSESFNARFRDECLNEHWLLSLADVSTLHSIGGTSTPRDRTKRVFP